MKGYLITFGAFALLALEGCAMLHRGTEQARTAAPSPCAANASFQRLAFWVGDWDVYDSTGVYYATQGVHPVVDACAIAADWTSGAGNKGMGISAFDPRSGEWRQVYVSNQVPSPSGVMIRRSD